MRVRSVYSYSAPLRSKEHTKAVVTEHTRLIRFSRNQVRERREVSDIIPTYDVREWLNGRFFRSELQLTKCRRNNSNPAIH